MKRTLFITILISMAFLSIAASKRLRIRGFPGPPTPPAPAVTNLVDVAGAIILDVGGGQIDAVK
jgi:hypothetical protein